jgi:4-amino-4-deoxy-L-arabinose transferase-like glycosyltransferase
MVRMQEIETQPVESSCLDKKVLGVIRLSTLLLALIILLAAWLRFVNLDAIGDGNTYYTAAVESMLQSWKNFFFVAAEPGGSVSVDKPPLGLWLQAISAFFLGVNGFAVMLPQILAGIAAVPVLYHLVKRYFGSMAGLAAALILALTPVVVAVDRNNTMDSTLVLALLLAAWAFIKATDEGQLRWLLVGGILVGLGFNIKMLQAFLPLPAFYALYFFGSRQKWLTKAVSLGLTTIVLLAVSLSWAVVVDLTPADSRPYVGSSEDNTVMELILGHNGLNRLFGGGGGAPQTSPDGQDGGTPENPPLSNPAPLVGATLDGGGPPLQLNDNPPLDGGQFAGPPQGGNQPLSGQAGGGIGNDEIGQPGVLRLFTQPLSNEIAWLLPLACISLLIVAASRRLKWPLGEAHKGWLLWGGWFLTTGVFFTVASFYHAYYLTMLAAPLAALVGAGLVSLGRWLRNGSPAAGLALAAAVVGTVLYQGTISMTYLDSALWLIPAFVLMVLAAMAISAVLMLGKVRWAAAAVALSLAAVLVLPGIWSGLTALDGSPNVNLPQAYEDHGDDSGNRRMVVDDKLLEFLMANTSENEYLMAVRSSMEGASYVLETSRPVLYMGGFNGSDPVVTAEDLQTMVTSGELRYVLWTPDGRTGSSSSGIERWLNGSCQPVSGLSLAAAGGGTRPGPLGDGPIAIGASSPGSILYQCDG